MEVINRTTSRGTKASENIIGYEARFSWRQL
jgi:hypothetical protein